MFAQSVSMIESLYLDVFATEDIGLVTILIMQLLHKIQDTFIFLDKFPTENMKAFHL